MERHFMIDIETTGVDLQRDEILQIAVLETTYEDGFWRPGRFMQLFQHTGRSPQGEFAKKHMTELYTMCRDVEWQSPTQIRAQLLDFFTQCGAESPNVYLMGWNASNFDVPFLVTHEYLVPSSYVPGPDGKEIMVGDFHYRIYELGGAVSLAYNALGYTDRGLLISDAKAAYDLTLPMGKEHDAVYDCYMQLRLLNGLIKLSRKGVSHG